jgi:hypothetical protein
MLIGVDSQQGGYNSAVFALRLRAVSKSLSNGGLSQEKSRFAPAVIAEN